jgi:signal peptidase I
MHSIQYFLLLTYILLCVGLYKIFEKAGEKGWKGLVPIYQFVVWLKILKKPWWWIILILIPTISWLMLFILAVETSKAFGKRALKDHILSIVFYYLYLPYLGFSKDEKYMGPPDESKRPKTWGKEWGEAGIFAVIAATIIRTFFIEAFTIPTSSLEKSLLVGDYLFVSKVSYGAKVPNTPLSFPFAHNTLPVGDMIPSYLEWVKLPNFRLPGIGHVERNDYVVFNFPEGDTVVVNPELSQMSYYAILRRIEAEHLVTDNQDPRDWLKLRHQLVVRPMDKEDNYVKRCVATPGDKLEIIDQKLYINGKPSYVSENMQYNYRVRTKTPGFNSALAQQQFDMTERVDSLDASGTEWIVTLPFKNVEKIKAADPDIDSIIPIVTPKGKYDYTIFPHSPKYPWNADNFGPLIMPKEGSTVQLSMDNLPLYERLISVYEENKLEKKDGKIFINGKEATSYTFKQDYYFMMGDNRHNSADSRFWGFVPEDHIVGKPVFIWMSIKKDVPGLKRFRWDRFFTLIYSDHLSKSIFLYVLIIGAGIWGWFRYKGKKNTAAPAKEILNKAGKK